MLERISIRNIGLIKQADIQLNRGLTVVTGETGAGKTVFVRTLLFGLGYIPSGLSALNPTEDAFIEVVFSKEIKSDDFEIIRREIRSDGKTSSFLNGRMTRQDVLKEITEGWIVVHSQNSTINLLKPAVQLKLVDYYSSKTALLRQEYRELYKSATQLYERLKELKIQAAEIENRIREYREYINDVESLGIKPGEENELKRMRDVLKNKALIVESIDMAVKALKESDPSATALLSNAVTGLNRISDRLEGIDEKISEIERIIEILNEISLELSSYINLDEDNLMDLDEIESRLYAIQRLKNRYSLPPDTDPALIAEEYRENIEKEYSFDQLTALENEFKQIYKKLEIKADELSGARRETISSIEKRVNEILRELKVGNNRFRINARQKNIKETTYPLLRMPEGVDEISFELDTGEERFEPVSKVASGGELSRIMLALETLQSNVEDAATVYIFDEIDTGIGGSTAVSVGKYLQELSQNKQVICITHLPQIAAFADTHFKVEKTGSGAKILQLDGRERVEEIARMLSGGLVEDEAIRHAEKLIEEARSTLEKG